MRRMTVTASRMCSLRSCVASLAAPSASASLKIERSYVMFAGSFRRVVFLIKRILSARVVLTVDYMCCESGCSECIVLEGDEGNLVMAKRVE